MAIPEYKIHVDDCILVPKVETPDIKSTADGIQNAGLSTESWKELHTVVSGL